VGNIDIGAIGQDRERLFAEAVATLRADGEIADAALNKKLTHQSKRLYNHATSAACLVDTSTGGVGGRHE
jgi:hypothetical protein